jgi:hypothetical protein
MKKSVRTVQVLSMAVLSPALMGQAHAVAARSVDSVGAVQIESGLPTNDPSFESAKAGFALSVFGSSLGEKLRQAGSHIPSLRIPSSIAPLMWSPAFYPQLDLRVAAHGLETSATCRFICSKKLPQKRKG